MGKKGGRALNPMDQFRREQHRKEVKKNKKDRARTREVAMALRDTTTADEVFEMEKLEEQGKLDKEGVKKLKLLREKLDKINAIRTAHGAKVLERPTEAESTDDTKVPDPLSVIPPGRDPKRSIYYDPVLNPYGAPPPGQPYMEYPPDVMPYTTEEAESAAAGQAGTEGEDVDESGSDASDSESSSGSSDSDSDSDKELDSDDDAWMPPLPEGPPPSKEDQHRFLAPSLPKPILRPPPIQHYQRPPFFPGHPHPGAFPPGIHGGPPMGGPFVPPGMPFRPPFGAGPPGPPGPFPPGPPGFMPPRPPMQPGMPIPMPPGAPPFGQPPFSPHMHHPPPQQHQQFSPRPPGQHRQFRPPRGGPSLPLPPPPALRDNQQEQQQQHAAPEDTDQGREAKRRKADSEEGGDASTLMDVDEVEADKMGQEGTIMAEEKPGVATTTTTTTGAATTPTVSKPKVHPLPPKPGTVSQPSSSSPLTTTNTTTATATATTSASRLSKPAVPAGPTSISAAPKLRNLQKELVHLVPSTILRKKVIQSQRIGKPVNAAPGVVDDDDDDENGDKADQQQKQQQQQQQQQQARVGAGWPTSAGVSSPSAANVAVTGGGGGGGGATLPIIPSLAASLSSTLTRRPLVNAAPDSDDESEEEEGGGEGQGRQGSGSGGGGGGSYTAGLGIRLPQINLAPKVTIGTTRIPINTAPSVDATAAAGSGATARPSSGTVDRHAKKKADYDEFLQSLEGDGLL